AFLVRWAHRLERQEGYLAAASPSPPAPTFVLPACYALRGGALGWSHFRLCAAWHRLARSTALRLAAPSDAVAALARAGLWRWRTYARLARTSNSKRAKCASSLSRWRARALADGWARTAAERLAALFRTRRGAREWVVGAVLASADLAAAGARTRTGGGRVGGAAAAEASLSLWLGPTVLPSRLWLWLAVVSARGERWGAALVATLLARRRVLAASFAHCAARAVSWRKAALRAAGAGGEVVLVADLLGVVEAAAGAGGACLSGWGTPFRAFVAAEQAAAEQAQAGLRSLESKSPKRGEAPRAIPAPRDSAGTSGEGEGEANSLRVGGARAGGSWLSAAAGAAALSPRAVFIPRPHAPASAHTVVGVRAQPTSWQRMRAASPRLTPGTAAGHASRPAGLAPGTTAVGLALALAGTPTPHSRARRATPTPATALADEARALRSSRSYAQRHAAGAVLAGRMTSRAPHEFD
ncbi:hypothetical protein T492DRAFT_869503, partial [Pavlovales sp. CCMP2436]